MNDDTYSAEHNHNGHHVQEEQTRESVNPYLRVSNSRRPPELARYDLNMDPYANVLPRADRFVTDTESPEWDPSPRGRSPWMAAISVMLILLLILPAMAQVWSHLFH